MFCRSSGGSVKQMARGVYRMGAPSPCEEEVLAAWLSLDPSRGSGSPTDVSHMSVAMGAAAAWLQQLGEIGPTPLEFCTVERKQTQRDGLTARKSSVTLTRFPSTESCGVSLAITFLRQFQLRAILFADSGLQRQCRTGEAAVRFPVSHVGTSRC